MEHQVSAQPGSRPQGIPRPSRLPRPTGATAYNDAATSLPAESTRKKPRPSLSERTIETMSHVPASPSPTRLGRSSAFTAAAELMPPPVHLKSPASHQRPRHEQAIFSPSKLVSPTPSWRSTTVEQTSLSTDSPVRVRAQQMAPDVRSTRYVPEGAPQYSASALSPKAVPTAHKARSLRDLKASAKQPVRKVSLNFKDITTNGSGEPRTASDAQPASPISKPRISNAKATSSLRKQSSILAERTKQPIEPTNQLSTSKTSASLRETIARAKAAKKQTSTPGAANAVESVQHERSINDNDDMFIGEGISSQSMRRRAQNAISTGILNVAALGLKTIPPEVLNMYDLNDDSQVNWAEAVDLTKFIIADNEVDELPDTVFPDWSVQELQEDEDKSNIFGGLQTLDFRGNKLVSLPIGLRRLERLSSLNLSSNKLTCDVFTILSQIPNLRDLSLAKNDLSGSLPFCMTQVSSLHSLDIHDNKLTSIDIPLSTLTKLRKLDVSGNLLKTLPIVELAGLHISDLNVSRNRLSAFDFPQHSEIVNKLEKLNLSSNELTQLWDESLRLPQLQYLIVDCNKLERLPTLSCCANLITLTASENRLVDIPDGFVELHTLRTANLSSNDIRVLDPYISKMENLSILNISGNPLRERKYLSMPTPDLKAELAKRLTAVYVRDDNNITPTTDLELSEVKTTQSYKIEKGSLNLSGREATTVDESKLDSTSTILSVDLSNNRLPGFPSQLLCHGTICNSLRSLILSYNATFDPEQYISSPLSLPTLRSLSLANTGIASTISLAQQLSAPALTDLDLSCNRLVGPMPSMRQHFPMLTTLLVSDNELTSITADSISGLEVVDIRNNNIEFLPPKIGELGNFHDEKRPGRLRTFECSGNKFRVPRLAIVEKGTEAILRDLRRMVITDELGEEWRS